ncbi:hypothetical protein H2200_011154 [Cladophialophora chaetospira]|uniref:Kinesin-like protein n=1 Tax=Cladophialophora chaetospira TaxID=386627 RepID=A0AA38X048_9EURO|nr:hypothetical protein H2200_011154 [Cladophialophora chaetospira]
MSNYQDVRPTNQRKIQDQQQQHSIAVDERSDHDGETEEAETRVDESTTSSGSDDLEDITRSESEHSSSEEADEEEGPLEEGVRASVFTTTTVPPQGTDLQSRLQEFLPRLQQANAALDGMEDDKRLDEVSDDDEHYIEMDLGLGVLTEQEKEHEKVKIPHSEDQNDDAADSQGAGEIKAQPPTSGAVPNKKATKRKIEELEFLVVIEECVELLDTEYTMVPPARPKTPSTASSPSLRSKTPVNVSMAPTNGLSPGGNVKVVVRVRAFLPREIERGAQCLIQMNPHTQSTKLLAPPSSDPANARAQTRKVVEEKLFTFDNSFWSHNTRDEHYATQEDVYNCLGEEFLDHNFEGYHTCIFAYGQTGSGKSYTMMGTPDQPGLIPRTCEDLFQRIEANESANISYSVRVSYFEVYNEHVRDLFQPKTDPPQYLKIRESPVEGPYVKDLTEIQVKNYGEILKYMRMGDNSRTVASTKMNDTSSRSHAVFTIMLKQIHHDYHTDETTERLARIRLVDLAGSERAKATEATGQRLREGGNINKSLTTLGRVIAALADPKNSRMQNKQRMNRDIVPYRDSILTWLLKDSLGGNSKTAMIACIAPSDYDETLSTLRYADQAKHIRTKAIVNQDHVSTAEKDAQINEMAETIRTLRWTLSQQQQNGSVSVMKAVQDSADAQSEKIREFTSKYENMLQIMEDKLAISESKVRQLEEEKEALSIHLKLVLDELRNPIIINKEETESVGERSRVPTPDMIYEDETASSDEVETDSEVNDEEAAEMQADLEALMSDLGMFKKKIAADHEMFGISLAA